MNEDAITAALAALQRDVSSLLSSTGTELRTMRAEIRAMGDDVAALRTDPPVTSPQHASNTMALIQRQIIRLRSDVDELKAGKAP